MLTKTAALLAAMVLGAAACGGGSDDGEEAAPAEDTAAPTTTVAEPEPELSDPITVELLEANKSGVSGTAHFEPELVGTIERYIVSLEVEPASGTAFVAHVHNVTCAEYAKIENLDDQIATVIAPLNDVRDGVSETAVPGSAAEGNYSVNVHQPDTPFPVVACGDVAVQ